MDTSPISPTLNGHVETVSSAPQRKSRFAKMTQNYVELGLNVRLAKSAKEEQNANKDKLVVNDNHHREIDALDHLETVANAPQRKSRFAKMSPNFVGLGLNVTLAKSPKQSQNANKDILVGNNSNFQDTAEFDSLKTVTSAPQRKSRFAKMSQTFVELGLNVTLAKSAHQAQNANKDTLANYNEPLQEFAVFDPNSPTYIDGVLAGLVHKFSMEAEKDGSLVQRELETSVITRFWDRTIIPAVIPDAGTIESLASKLVKQVLNAAQNQLEREGNQQSQKALNEIYIKKKNDVGDSEDTEIDNFVGDVLLAISKDVSSSVDRALTPAPVVAPHKRGVLTKAKKLLCFTIAEKEMEPKPQVDTGTETAMLEEKTIPSQDITVAAADLKSTTDAYSAVKKVSFGKRLFRRLFGCRR